jgi:hypothetical protein
MKVMFTEHCNGSSHLVKVTIAEQNDGVKTDNPNESSLVKKYGKHGMRLFDKLPVGLASDAI